VLYAGCRLRSGHGAVLRGGTERQDQVPATGARLGIVGSDGSWDPVEHGDVARVREHSGRG
jgi:hypothetical protein